ncbi:hypothetical protein JOC37_000452 [Desulfohalotomaculum tongense]|uniref:hypothetical protein n=1 Tax=Desulforadius tongensis TaxID=1216062 RepID=UPI001956679C|nr:hypothetical protein [Desulforadius tongensis]MBM7854080.1 hypothetical protein [Desulforadius tongensis]
MAERCLMCGKLLEKEEEQKNDHWWDDEDDFIPKPKKKTASFCQMCEAKLRKESDDAHKGPRKQM